MAHPARLERAAPTFGDLVLRVGDELLQHVYRDIQLGSGLLEAWTHSRGSVAKSRENFLQVHARSSCCRGR
jgi:hypothetical protein